MEIIARVRTPFEEKFGIPRQSGLAHAESKIIFEPLYRNIEAVRGIEGFSHLWLIWQFSESPGKEWSPTVRPPKLGGNKRMGVFATRSPFRPNPIGLSSVELLRVDRQCADAPVIFVSGADILDNTPIYDIKPYLPYTDSHPDASGGFAEEQLTKTLTVYIPDDIKAALGEKRCREVEELLIQDPRPGYIDDPDRIFYLKYNGSEIAFRVENGRAIAVSIK